MPRIIAAAKEAATAMARRSRSAIVVVPLLAGALNVQLNESSREGSVHAARLAPGPRQITGIAGIRVARQPMLVYDHLTDKREPNHIPDLPMTAWKEADGTVNLLVPHFQNYRMRGPDLEH